MKLLLTLFSTAALTLSSTVFAGENCENCKKEGKEKNATKAEKIKESMLKKFDADGDGKLSESEREAAKAHRKEMASKFDLDGDGKLSESEREAAKAAMKAKKKDSKA